MQWRRNPQRAAWIILITSFCLCCLLLVTVPLAVRDYLLHATRPQAVRMTAMAGTAQLWAPQAEVATAVTESRSVSEGSRIVTDGNARALITISPDASRSQPAMTIQLFQSTSIEVTQAQTARFRWGREPDSVVLTLLQGRVSVATNAAAEERPLAVTVRSSGGSVLMDSGSLYVGAQGDQTEVTVRLGSARVVGGGQEVAAVAGERVTVATGAAPDPPVPAALNLVRNGTFSSPLYPDWQEVRDPISVLTPAELTREWDGQRSVIHFSRRAEDGSPYKVGIQQNVGRDVQTFDSLVVRFDLRLLYQSVPGGGSMDSEYPVMVDIAYTDVYGKNLHWYEGFYYQDLPASSNWKQPSGEKVLPLGAWYTYESPNLFEEQRDTRPMRINSITIYASGHDYESQIADVALIVR